MIPRLAFLLFFFPLVCVAGLKWERTRLSVPAEVGQEEVVGIYQFTNTGDEPVTILRTQSSCGCTVPKLEKETYAPGESGELKAIFTVGDRTGHQRKILTVTTDNHAHPVTRLIFETSIPEVVSIKPKMVHWRRGDEPEWQEVALTTDPANRIAIPENTADEALPDHELIPSDDTPGAYTLRLRPANTTARTKAQFPIAVELPDGEQISYKVYLLVR